VGKQKNAKPSYGGKITPAKCAGVMVGFVPLPLSPYVYLRQGTRTDTVGHLIYRNSEHRVQRQNLVLAWPCPVVLRYCSGEAVPRPKRHIKARDLWLGNDPSTYS